MIVAKEPAEPRPATDGTARTRWREPVRRNQPIVQALVIPFLVVMRHERGERPTQVGFPQDDNLIQAFLLDGPNETLRVRIAVGRLERRLHDANTAIGQRLAAGRAPLGIAIADQGPVAPEAPVICGGEHPRDLAHEGVIRMRRRAHEMHASGRQLDDEERVVRDQPAGRPHFRCEEIRGGDHAPMRGQKRAPRPRPLRHRTDSGGSKDHGDRGSGDTMPKVLQGSLDPAIAPCRILPRHAKGQLTDLAEHARSSDAASLSRPLSHDELAMPPQEGIGCDQRRDLTQDLASETVAVRGESTPLGIGQPQRPPVEVLFEDAVLFP